MIMDIATKDPLTKALSRGSFEILIDQEIARQKRYGGVFSLAFIDLNDFKKLNDTKGHHIGDEALRLLTETLHDCTRKTDFVGRMGGDEFAILMLHSENDACKTICHHFSNTIESRMISAGFNITASIGYLSFEQPPESAVEALDKVDKLMYMVKANYKNGIAANL
jgi:diguanylate cyclase (GGDEF)-like protein